MDLSVIDPRFLYDDISNKSLSKKVKNIDKTFHNKLNKELEKKKLKEVSEQLESIFTDMMFKEMRKNLNKHRLIPQNSAEKIFDEMLYKEYSLKLARSNQLGFAKMIYDNLSKYI